MYHYAARGGTSHAICNTHKDFGEDQTCSSEDMIVDIQTYTHTDTLITILRLPIEGGVVNGNSYHF